MPVRVNLRKWGGTNRSYIAAWILMGIIIFMLLTWKLRLGILLLIGPFIPYFIITMARIHQEMNG